jgi:hypothetical protein
LADIVAERFDIGIRLGSDVAKDMIAVRIAPDMRMALVGSPEYFSLHPQPHSPQDLTEHDCITLRLPTHGGLLPWEFKQGDRTVNAHVKGRLVLNNSDLMVAAAIAGYGLTWVPDEIVAKTRHRWSLGDGFGRPCDDLPGISPVLRKPSCLARFSAGGRGIALQEKKPVSRVTRRSWLEYSIRKSFKPIHRAWTHEARRLRMIIGGDARLSAAKQGVESAATTRDKAYSLSGVVAGVRDGKTI